jgi:broad specificity phosphatase PhoE
MSGPSDDVYLTRHSARADRDHARWRPLPGRSSDDTELSEGGEVATQQLTTRFQNIHLDHIVSSPFYRCMQTVAPIAQAKGLKIKVEPGICEVLGIFPPGFWSAEKLATETNLPVDTDYKPAVQISDLSKEYSDSECASRARQAVLDVRKDLEGSILFCGHGASCLGIAEAFGSRGYIGYSSFCHFRQASNGKWKALDFGDVSHLEGELRKQSLSSAW